MRFFKICLVLHLCSISLFACRSNADPVVVDVVEEDTIRSIKLLFVGDIMGHTPQIKSAYDASTKSYNYEPCFKYVKPIISAADFAIGNLEVTLPGKPPYKGYPQFRSPDALAYALKDAGFDMLVTANNHTNDSGKQGLLHTIDTVRNLGFYQTGSFRDQADRDNTYPQIVFVDSFKLAVLNYTYGTNGLPDVPPTIVNLIDEDLIKKDMAFAQRLKPDMIIVITHWGAEYQLNENKFQQKLTDSLFAWGAELVIGAHPHVIQPIKERKLLQADSSYKKGLVAYSMGNFISNQRQPNTDGGIMVEVELHKDLRTNETNVGEHAFVPVWRYIDKSDQALNKEYGTYYAVPVSAFENDTLNQLKMTEADIKKMKASVKNTRSHLGKFGAKEKKYDLKTVLQNQALPVEETKEQSSWNVDDNYQPITTSNTGITKTESGLFFKIQFQASKELNARSSYPFENIEIVSENGWYRYLVGKENNREAAEKVLNFVRKNGFPDAFIVRYENGIRLK